MSQANAKQEIKRIDTFLLKKQRDYNHMPKHEFDEKFKHLTWLKAQLVSIISEGR